MNEPDPTEAAIARLRRKDIPAIERASAYQRFRDDGYSCREIAELLHFTKRHVQKMLKLLTLAPGVIDAIEAGKLRAEHGLALANASTSVQLAALRLILTKAAGWRTAEEIKRSIGGNVQGQA